MSHNSFENNQYFINKKNGLAKNPQVLLKTFDSRFLTQNQPSSTLGDTVGRIFLPNRAYDLLPCGARRRRFLPRPAGRRGRVAGGSTGLQIGSRAWNLGHCCNEFDSWHFGASNVMSTK